jgi:site-specific DNA-cytosine methylase
LRLQGPAQNSEMNVALPTIVELCAGYGGIGLGVALACGETRPLVYVEREITAARILVARFQDGTMAPADVWSDVKTFNGRPYRGKTDILCAGYPCQPFSCAGKQLGRKDPRHLWPHVARIIDEIQPKQVFLENVDAHLRIGFLEVARELSGMGYRGSAGLFSAEEVGAPHRRLRLFALAERTPGGRGELRQSSWLDGFTDGSDEELVDSYQATKGPIHQLEDSARLSEYRQIRQDGGGRWRVRQTGDELAAPGDGLVPLKGGARKDEQGLDQQARLWRTPDTPHGGGIRTHTTSRGKGHQIVLAEQAQQWPTPEAHFNPRGPGFAAQDSHYKPHDLATAADQWPTPQARDIRSGVTGNVKKKNARPLSKVASQSFLRARQISKRGTNSSETSRMLNPRFVEMLMNLPPGFTDARSPLAYQDFAHWETASSRWLRHMLTSPSPEHLAKGARS